MKLALVDNIRTTATKGANATCPYCGSKVVAKCGDLKANHWAHKGIRNCDPWWENETEWHRSWKGNFSTEWQEVIASDEATGEKHIADIRTNYGLVIEFQHSHIDANERSSRENFYKTMIWVIDGTRLKRDYPRFLRAKERFRLTDKSGIYVVDFPKECFPLAWIGSAVPVVFDFKGVEPMNDSDSWRNHLYYLFPQSSEKAMIAILSREVFINGLITGKLFAKKEEEQTQIAQSVPSVRRNTPQSQYIYHRGRYIKRRRL